MTLESKHVSRSRLDEIGMGDPAFTAELIDIMLEDGQLRMAKIRAAFDQQQMSDVGAIAHSLKGAALNIGARDLAELCASIDDSVRKVGQAIEAQRISQLEEEFRNVARELHEIRGALTA